VRRPRPLTSVVPELTWRNELVIATIKGPTSCCDIFDGVLPREAREGIERAWLEILRERHPGIEWQIVPSKTPAKETDAPISPQQDKSRFDDLQAGRPPVGSRRLTDSS
jgi:hypothetical protein